MGTASSLWDDLRPGMSLTIVKAHYLPGNLEYAYPARMIGSDRPGWFAFEAVWALPDMDVDGILYETGGKLIEYFSPTQRFNVFHVFRRNGESSGYYANVTEPPTLAHNEEGELVLTWIDCWLDVVKLPNGEIHLLDEDELDASGIAHTDPVLAKCIREAGAAAIATLTSPEWDD